MGQWISVIGESRYAIRNDIVCGRDAISINPHWIVDHECALETAESLASRRGLGSSADPCLGGNVVSEEQCGWERVVVSRRREKNRRSRYIVYDDGCVFEGIDTDGRVGALFSGACLDVVWPLKMPPETKVLRVSSCCVRG